MNDLPSPHHGSEDNLFQFSILMNAQINVLGSYMGKILPKDRVKILMHFMRIAVEVHAISFIFCIRWFEVMLECK